MLERSELAAGDRALAVWLGRLQETSFNRPVRLGNVRAIPWLALSVIEGEHNTHAAVLTEGPAEVLTAVPRDVRNSTELRNAGASLDWATAWLRVNPAAAVQLRRARRAERVR